MLGLQPVTLVTIAAALTFGMVLALLGGLKLALAKRLDLNEGRVGGLFAALNLALVPMMVLSGLCVDRGGATAVLLGGSLVTALAVYGLGVRPGYREVVAALFVAGLGSAGLCTAAVVLAPQAFFGSGQVTASLSLATVFVALGAVLTPPLTGVLMHRLEWRRALAVVAVLCLAPAVLAALAGRQLAALRPEPTPLGDLLEQPALWLAGAVFLFYAPLEGAVSVWATTYLTEAGFSERRAAGLLSGFWGAFLTARLALAYGGHYGIVTSGWEPWLLVLPPLLSAAVLGNLVGATARAQAWLGMLGLGLLLGPFFPTLLGLLFRRLDAAKLAGEGTAYGCVFALGSFGSLLLAPLVGAAARRRTVHVALRIPLLLALALTLAALVFCLAT